MSLGADRAVSNERTALAWQRTALSLVAAAAILARLTMEDVPLVAVGLLMAALGLTTWVFLASRRRYAGTAGLHAGAVGRGGRAPAALALATCLLCITELAALLAR